MDKKAKRIRVMVALDMAISHSMSLHPEFDRDYCDNPSGLFRCEDCNDRNSCNPAVFLISFFDYDNNLLAENILAESYSHREYCRREESISKTINELCDEFDIDINHLMGGKEDNLLHKVRHVEITLVDKVVYDDDGNYLYTVRRGVRYNPFYGSVELRYKYCYHKIKYGDNDDVPNYLESKYSYFDDLD